MQISRTPLREALKVLTAEGLVRHEPRRGCFVNEVTEQDLDEIFPVHRAAGRALRLRGGAATPATPTCRRWRRCTSKLSRHAKAKRINEYYATNFAIHEAIITLADNRWLAQVIGDLRKIVKLARLQQLHAPGRLDQSLSEHLAVFAALKARDPEGAEAAMRTHLTRQREALRELARTPASRGSIHHECRARLDLPQRLAVAPRHRARGRPTRGPAAPSAAPPRRRRAHARAPEGHAAARPGGAVAAGAAPHAGGAAGDRRPAASARSRAGAAPRRWPAGTPRPRPRSGATAGC